MNIPAGLHSTGRNGLRNANGKADLATEGGVQLAVVNVNLGLATDTGHHLDSQDREGTCAIISAKALNVFQGYVGPTLSGLSRQHHTVRSVQDGVGNVGGFGTGGTGIYDHGFQHLGGGDDVFAHGVTLADHHLLIPSNCSFKTVVSHLSNAVRVKQI